MGKRELWQRLVSLRDDQGQGVQDQAWPRKHLLLRASQSCWLQAALLQPNSSMTQEETEMKKRAQKPLLLQSRLSSISLPSRTAFMPCGFLVFSSRSCLWLCFWSDSSSSVFGGARRTGQEGLGREATPQPWLLPPFFLRLLLGKGQGMQLPLVPHAGLVCILGSRVQLFVRDHTTPQFKCLKQSYLLYYAAVPLKMFINKQAWVSSRQGKKPNAIKTDSESKEMTEVEVILWALRSPQSMNKLRCHAAQSVPWFPLEHPGCSTAPETSFQPPQLLPEGHDGARPAISPSERGPTSKMEQSAMWAQTTFPSATKSLQSVCASGPSWRPPETSLSLQPSQFPDGFWTISTI